MNTKDYGRHASGLLQADGGPSKRFVRRYPAISGLTVMAAGAVTAVCAMLWILSHDGCSHPLGAIVAMLALAVGGVFALTPLLLLAASDAPWLFPEDSGRG